MKPRLFILLIIGGLLVFIYLMSLLGEGISG
jgi:hypothetical protein